MNSKELFSRIFTGPPSKQRRPAAKRAFRGLQGSVFAKYDKLGEQPSDHTLRETLTPDKQEPIGFDPWYDEFKQRHAQIDLDCDFQSHAFDEHLGGKAPEGAAHVTVIKKPADESVSDHFGVDRTLPKHKQNGVRFGLVEGARLEKRRRRTDTTWWIFEADLFRGFIKTIYEKDQTRAKIALFVFYHYYFRNREDAEIYLYQQEKWKDDGDWWTALSFKDEKAIKNFRQRVLDEGNEMYPVSLREKSGSHGRRGKWTGGQKCGDPECPCHKNETSHDFTAR
jgi:hypothetical protein